MLRTLSVENYVLIERLEMNLGPGLNIVTGETGAGKSILLGALGLLLGTRGESGVQKDPSRACVVEGVFMLSGGGVDGSAAVANLEDFFAENDLEYSPEIVVRRVISASGKSRAYVSELPVPLTVLRALGERLIDIHSQHENLLLRDDGFRVSILDGVAGQGALVQHYGEVFGRWRELLRRLSEARAAGAEAARDEEWLRHQATELSGLALTDGEQEDLEAEQLELSHSDEIREVFGAAAAELGGGFAANSGGGSGAGFGADELGIIARLRALRGALERIEGIHLRAASLAERLGSAHLELQDLEREIVAEYERIDGDPERLAKVAARLDAIYALQQKHRVTSVAQLLDLQADFEAQLSSIENGSEHITALEAEVATAENEARETAERISAGRRQAVTEVERSVSEMLRRLGMSETQFVVELTPAAELRKNGADEVRFLFTANSSMAPRPVEKIASGGEISRVMLALKTLSARSAGLPTVVFDEIDAGVSGRVADAMGDIIAELGTHSQVLNITHLPQIAAKPGEHFLVYKKDGATHIRQLTEPERVTEIAAMLSGSSVTDAALRQARELLNSK